VNKDVKDVSQCLVFSPLSVLKGVFVYLSLIDKQGGGIHTEEEFNPWIRVCVFFFTGQMIVNIVLVFTVKIFSQGLILYLEIGY
jgi:hypothetical protein